jgi:hypothetical protein
LQGRREDGRVLDSRGRIDACCNLAVEVVNESRTTL